MTKEAAPGAARALNPAQSAIRHAVRALERAFDMGLFERKKIIRFKHSDFIERTKRSANAFKFGDRGGSRMR